MIDKFDLEKERYKIAAMLSECVLFEYHITSKTLYKFDSYGDILKGFDIIRNFRYNDRFLRMIHERDLERFYEFCNELEMGKERLKLDIRVLDSHNEYQWLQIKGRTLYDKERNPVKVIGRISNIDVQKKEREKLRERSERDPLTTLYNKETTERLINKFLKIESMAYKGILFLIDFDNFKGINDSLGHLFGDSVLRDVSAQLRRIFRSTDVIGRVGGDEFVIYINGKHNNDTILQKTEEIQRIFDRIYTDRGKVLKTSCSIGIAIAPKHGTNYKELFKRADIALYQAKNRGKACYQIFDESKVNINILKCKKLFNKYEDREEHIVNEGHQFSDSIVPYFNLLYFSEDFKSTMNLVLSMVGQEYGLDRMYIGELNQDHYIECTYEWTSDHTVSSDSMDGRLYPFSFEGYEELFNEDGVFYTSDITNLEFQSEATYDYLAGKNVKSVLHCRVLEDGMLKGIVSCEVCNKIHTWKKKELDSLIVISRMTGSFLKYNQGRKQLKEHRVILEEISKNQNLFSYIIKPNTFEVLEISTGTTGKYPDAKKGDICYKVFGNEDVPCENCPMLGLTSEITRNTVDFYHQKENLRLKSTATRINIDGQEGILVCAAEVTDIIETIQGKDDLTGLISLSRFEKEAKQLLTVRRNYSILSLDIDKFKNINSTLGYQEGNRMLIALANIIAAKLMPGELFCRSYADKYLIMLEYDRYNNIIARANRIFNDAINCLQGRYKDVHIVLAGGLYMITGDDNEITDTIDNANIARKSIKGSHQSILAVYDDKIHRKVMQEKQVETRMSAALSNKEFVVYFQPKIDLKSNAIVGAEALVRWKIDENNIIPPNEFIPIFERNGFINQMDFYVYESVFRKMQEWIRKGYKIIPVSVNISRTHMTEKDFVMKMKTLVNRYNIPPEMVELEITEGIFLSDKGPLIEVLDNLKKAGFHLSIDDFGSGYSSLNLLRHLKMDVLKLDKEFFDQDRISKKESIVLANVIRMSKELGMVVLSEGVETKEQVDYLTSIGCDLAQGYYFARPMPMEEFGEIYL